MAKVKKTRLTHMVYDEVSSVDAGANQDAHVVLMKRDGGKKVAKKIVLKKKADAPPVEEVEEVEAPDLSPAGAKFVKQEAGVAIYDDGSKFDGETWHDVPAGTDDEVVPPVDPEVEDPDEDEEVEPAEMSKADHNGVELDVLRLAAEFAQNISKAFAPTVPLDERASKYEEAILGFNRAMDDAANGHWLVGTGITKSDDSEAVNKNVARIAEIFEHATTAAGGEIVTKNDDKSTDIYKGLTPEAAEIVRKSAEVLEANEVSKFEGIAKSFKNVPADATKLGAALRKSHDTDPEGYATLTAALSAANEGLADSEVFKSLGVAGGGEAGEYADIEKAATAAVEAGTYATKELAEVALMQANPGKFYKSTN